MPENVNIDLFIDEDDLLPMSALEYDEEVKLETNEKMELVKYCIFCTSIIKPPKKCRTI